MKSLIFILSLLSFVMYRATKTEAPLNGTWNGSYRTAEKNAKLTIVFGPGNEVELYSSEIEKTSKATGTYAVNYNEIAITCQWPGKDRIPFIIKGRLSPKQNFVDGSWETETSSSGNFYLAKAMSN